MTSDPRFMSMMLDFIRITCQITFTQRKGPLTMAHIYKALLLAAAMIGISVLAAYNIVPSSLAQWAPFALLAIFPSIWMGDTKTCGAAR